MPALARRRKAAQRTDHFICAVPQPPDVTSSRRAPSAPGGGPLQTASRCLAVDRSTRCVPAGLLPNGGRRIVISRVHERCLGLRVRVHPSTHQVDRIRPHLSVGIIEHHGDRAWQHGRRIGPTAVVLAPVTRKRMASLETHSRIDVIKHPDERHETVRINEMIHRLRRPTTNVVVRRVEAALHALERIRSTEHEVPERTLRADRVSEKTDPPVVVVVLRNRYHERIFSSSGGDAGRVCTATYRHCDTCDHPRSCRRLNCRWLLRSLRSLDDLRRLRR